MNAFLKLSLLWIMSFCLGHAETALARLLLTVDDRLTAAKNIIPFNACHFIGRHKDIMAYQST